MKKLIRLQDFRFRKTKDSHYDLSSPYRNPMGFVEIWNKSNKSMLWKSNLIVYDGREIFPQVLFKTDRVAASGEKDMFLSWISVGDGGADPGDPNLPIDPDLEDTSLSNELVISLTDPDCTADGKKKKISNVDFIQDINNNNRYLIVKGIIVLEEDQVNGNDLNEAALWFADTNDPSTVTTFKLASRITFPSIYKTSSLELILAWYYFM